MTLLPRIPRHFMPVVLRESIFRSLRLVGHPGIKGTYKLVKTRYFWSDMDGNIRNGVEFVFPVNRVKLQSTLVVQFQVLTFRQTVSKRYTLILLVRYHQWKILWIHSWVQIAIFWLVDRTTRWVAASLTQNNSISSGTCFSCN